MDGRKVISYNLVMADVYKVQKAVSYMFGGPAMVSHIEHSVRECIWSADVF